MGKGTTGIYYALVSVAITVLIFVFLKKKSKNKQILQSE